MCRPLLPGGLGLASYLYPLIPQRLVDGGVSFPYPMRFTKWEGTGARGSPPKVKFLSLWAWHPDSF